MELRQITCEMTEDFANDDDDDDHADENEEKEEEEALPKKKTTHIRARRTHGLAYFMSTMYDVCVEIYIFTNSTSHFHFSLYRRANE